MPVNKTKKCGKYRGHTTHGGGHRKKRRGAGSRGGRGNAGTGKRAGQKKAGMLPQLGALGFTPRGRESKSKQSINLSDLSSVKLDRWVAAKKAAKQGDVYVIDLTKLGYHKLLGAGSTNLKLQITVDQASKLAVKKLKKAGGKVVTVEAEPVKEAVSEEVAKTSE
ncbi:MAG: uL15 family ribosomal protein [archaeon]|nr:uL15 family ribosomal protein [Nanoarchaeota archaeon]